MSWYRIFSKLYKKRDFKISEELRDFIGENSTILDIGCGTGTLTRTIQSQLKPKKIIGVDIQDFREAKDFPFFLYNGKNLPFKDKQFDVVLIAYVLHHARWQKELVKEAKRVAKKNSIIFENLPDGFSGKFFCWTHLIAHKIAFGFNHPLKGQFKTEEEWKNFFGRIQLNIIFKKKIKSPLRYIHPAERIMFVLRV